MRRGEGPRRREPQRTHRGRRGVLPGGQPGQARRRQGVGVRAGHGEEPAGFPPRLPPGVVLDANDDVRQGLARRPAAAVPGPALRRPQSRPRRLLPNRAGVQFRGRGRRRRRGGGRGRGGRLSSALPGAARDRVVRAFPRGRPRRRVRALGPDAAGRGRVPVRGPCRRGEGARDAGRRVFAAGGLAGGRVCGRRSRRRGDVREVSGGVVRARGAGARDGGEAAGARGAGEEGERRGASEGVPRLLTRSPES
mmetsp:Transcript_6374/g.29135  ORF Transcript_6374/g.29135 Transcript_6374/m.29135 type:complete len:251 (+) Transcript_6374:194-946(+)